MMTETRVHSDLPIPPGEFLEEVIGDLGMTKHELAKRMGRPASKLNEIFKGRKAITADTALQLEKVLGVPANIWTGLEGEYRLILATQEAERERRESLKEETKYIKLFCYAELAKLGIVPAVTGAMDKVLALQKFFGVTSLGSVLTLRRYSAAHRCGLAEKKRSPEAVAAWLRIGELAAARIECKPFNSGRLESMLPAIRRMTTEAPDAFVPRLTAMLASAGVALVICPHLPKTYAHGAVFPLGAEKVALMLTIRGKYADVFWFTLFHELGHILRHKRQEAIVEYAKGGSETDQLEREADEFASDALIPPEQWKRFIRRDPFYKNKIQTFATGCGIDAGIVVGRLHHEGLLDQKFANDLRNKYVWIED
ncbi:MAG: helix-turn-helix protein [bacterium ADurb.Bin236]|nr:MAG: helix-turn-helix protein [bacterium ADurb.Bin236]HOY63956.1 HigA family addiction module antitoxin [bacterium]